MHYVCSDIHGQYTMYQQLLKELNLQPEDTLYILGDVIDRGPQSFEILQDMMARPNVEMFLGNHELMMMDALHLYRRISRPDIWFLGCNGGYETYQQFDALPKDMQKKIIEYISNAWVQKYVTVDDTTYALHHSFYLPDKENQDVRHSGKIDGMELFDAVWNSPYRSYEYIPSTWYHEGCIHIIGHVPVQRLGVKQPPYIDQDNENVIDIDGGCAYAGPGAGLYCMSLERNENGPVREIWIPFPSK